MKKYWYISHENADEKAGVTIGINSAIIPSRENEPIYTLGDSGFF